MVREAVMAGEQRSIAIGSKEMVVGGERAAGIEGSGLAREVEPSHRLCMGHLPRQG